LANKDMHVFSHPHFCIVSL